MIIKNHRVVFRRKTQDDSFRIGTVKAVSNHVFRVRFDDETKDTIVPFNESWVIIDDTDVLMLFFGSSKTPVYYLSKKDIKDKEFGEKLDVKKLSLDNAFVSYFTHTDADELYVVDPYDLKITNLDTGKVISSSTDNLDAAKSKDNQHFIEIPLRNSLDAYRINENEEKEVQSTKVSTEPKTEEIVKIKSDTDTPNVMKLRDGTFGWIYGNYIIPFDIHKPISLVTSIENKKIVDSLYHADVLDIFIQMRNVSLNGAKLDTSKWKLVRDFAAEEEQRRREEEEQKHREEKLGVRTYCIKNDLDQLSNELDPDTYEYLLSLLEDHIGTAYDQLD